MPPDPASAVGGPRSPRVSVIMSVFNGERHLEECLESLWAQKFTDFEVLAVDDGSQDSSRALLAAQSDPRLRVLPQEVNRGLPTCLNLGIREARGELLARMDADDICFPERLGDQVAFLDAHPEVAVLGSAVKTLKADGSGEVLAFPLSDPEIKAQIPFGCPFFHPTVMLRKSALAAHQLWYDESFRRSQDYELWERAADHLGFANLPEPRLFFRRHQASVSFADRPVQTDFAERVRERCLRRSFPDLQDEEIALHNQLLALEPGPHQALTDAVEAWLTKLEDLNRRLERFPAAPFSRALGMRWYVFCTKLVPQGLSTYRRFWASPLAALAGLDFRQRVGQLLRSLGLYQERPVF